MYLHALYQIKRVEIIGGITCERVHWYDKVKWLLKEGEPVDITNKLLPTPESLISDATRNSLIGWKFNNLSWGSMHAPRPPSLMSIMIQFANEKSCTIHWSIPIVLTPSTRQLLHFSPSLMQILNETLILVIRGMSFCIMYYSSRLSSWLVHPFPSSKTRIRVCTYSVFENMHLILRCAYRVYANRMYDPITTRKFNFSNCLYSVRTEATACNYFLSIQLVQ